MEENDNREGKVNFLIENATNSPSHEVDSGLLKAIKSVVRYSDSEVRFAIESLMQKMKRDHAQVRYLALLIIDELFMRSKLFRSLLIVKFDEFLSLSIGFRRTSPLPAPPAIATRLRSKAIEFLEKWNTSFGIHYRQLRLGFDYLKNTLRFQFPNLQQNAARIEQERRDREIKSKEILLDKFKTLRENISLIKDEIQTTINETCECLDILCPKEDDLIPPNLSSDDEVEEYKCSALQQIRLESLKEGEKVLEDTDNKVVFDMLRELYKLVVTKHMVSVQEWISVLVRVEPAETRFRDSTLKEFIDVHNHLKSLKKKCEQAGCTLGTMNNKDEDIWEEDKIEAYDNMILSANNIRSEGLASTSTACEEKNRTPDNTTEIKCSDGFESTSLKKSLLSEAPVMTWGSFLDDWGSKRDFLANQRGLELDGHWGRVDYDAVIPAEKIAELNVQATLYKEDHVEIRPCLAPLRKGGLCQRRDLKTCPFHGPIIPRDSEGNPIDQALPSDDKTIGAETEVVDRLAKQAVKNVRERDRDEAKQKENNRHQLKRAKLAKVREHNDVVLREAAIASTSHSELEHLGAAVQNDRRIKEKKQTLASMLRKKITPRDRIVQRLSNTRTRDATSQWMMGEDAKYREAYPNQW